MPTSVSTPRRILPNHSVNPNTAPAQSQCQCQTRPQDWRYDSTPSANLFLALTTESSKTLCVAIISALISAHPRSELGLSSVAPEEEGGLAQSFFFSTQ